MEEKTGLQGLLQRAEELAGQTPPQLEQPKGIVNGTMHAHQLVALSWLVSLYNSNVGGILGDEMGLGKTLTAISMLTHLIDEKKNKGPFLVVVPLSTLDNWAKEFNHFAPAIRVLRYVGDQDERQKIRERVVDSIVTQPKAKRNDPDLDFDVLLASYETVMNDSEFLMKFKWRYCIVDEAQRLKNHNSALYILMMKHFKIQHKLLLTGTPLQNNLKELWALLHFVAPKFFSNLEQFEAWFADVDWKAAKKDLVPTEGSPKDSKVSQLHSLIRPFLLRRLKTNVNINLPDKREIIIYTGMSSMQKKYYKWVLTKDIAKLTQGSTGKKTRNRMSLMNVIMQLRKCCNHPYLFDGAEPLFDGKYEIGDHIIENSGKLSLLDKLLPKLQSENHRVLIFSQMTRMLDILQDYLHYRGYNYERLDGSVRGEERYLAIETFQTKDEEVAEEDRPFVFLLSTRAGGLGLNLTAADTVIFIDSDWNPQADLQAEARVHRIGQEKNVTVIRLLTKFTVEEVIFQRALRKLQLSQTIIEEGKFSIGTEDQEEVEKETPEQLFDVIQYGLSNVCNNEDSTIEDEDIETILANSAPVPTVEQIQEHEKGKEKEDSGAKKVQSLSLSEMEHSLSATQGEADNPMYYYEGHDYTEETKKADSDVLGALLQKPKSADSEIALTPRRRFQLRGRHVSYDMEEEKKKQLQNKMKKKQAKWLKAGYFSSAVRLEDFSIQAGKQKESADDEADTQEIENEEEGGELAPKTPVKDRASKGRWECKTCTFVNESPTAERCEMCDAFISKEEDAEMKDVEDVTKDKGTTEKKEKEKEKEPETEKATEIEKEGSQIEENENKEAEGEEEDIHFAVGDVTAPYHQIDSAKNAIIVACCDNSGSWGGGGLFSALDRLSNLPQQTYMKAGENQDLELGDLHLVNYKGPIEGLPSSQDPFNLETLSVVKGEAGGHCCIALIIAQKRTRGRISGILLEHLVEALQKLQLLAKKLNASIHLPRFGSPADWYSIERSVRSCLVAKGIPTYVYYFKRSRGGRRRKRRDGSQGGSYSGSYDSGSSYHSQSSDRQVDVPSSPPKKKSKIEARPSQEEQQPETPAKNVQAKGKEKELEEKKEEEEEEEEEEQIWVPKKVVTSSQSSANGTSASPTDLFASCKFYIHIVGADYSRLRKSIIRNGGKVESTFTPRITHLITSKRNLDDAMKAAQQLNAGVKVLHFSWVDACVLEKAMVPRTHSYLLLE